MRLLVVGCIALMVGIGIGLYGVSAASNIKYDSYVIGKDVPKMSDPFMNGYAAGTYDTLETVVWMANDDPQSKDDFTAANFTGYYQCLQKASKSSEVVAWGKELWAKSPNMIAANTLLINACQFKPGAASANTMTRGAGRDLSRTGTNHR